MPKYLFHLHDGPDLPDHTGSELPDIEAVRFEAVRTAGEAIRDLGEKFWSLERWWLDVTDEQGRDVLTLTVMAAVD